MSLAAHSPTIGHKRLLSDSDSPDTTPHLSKRSRQLRKVRPSRCSSHRFQNADNDLLLATLKSLFPQMEETVVVTVLDKYGQDIDEAIRQLGMLQVSHIQDQNKTLGAHSLRDNPTPAAQPVTLDPLQGRAPSGAQQSGAAEEKEAEVVKTPAEWVDGLVQQMAAAKDLPDARVRAASELRTFEQAVMRSTNKARTADIQAAQGKVSDISKENAVLKRAVNILQTRLQEASNVNKQQAQQAESAVTALQRKVHSLEMANYSLSMHLKQATDSRHNQHHQHPDVF